MNKSLLILGLCGLAVAGCTETRVVYDNSVQAQFMRLESRGARVQLGDGSEQAKERADQQAKLAANQPTDTYNPNFQPFRNSKWSTNFKVDQTDPNSANVTPSAPPPPPAGAPLMGGMTLPDTSAAQPAH